MMRTDQDEMVVAAEENLASAQEAALKAEAAVKKAEADLWYAVNEGGNGLPSDEGWYLDAEDCVWRRGPEGVWDDGWGNFGPMYGYPNPPLRRMAVVRVHAQREES